VDRWTYDLAQTEPVSSTPTQPSLSWVFCCPGVHMHGTVYRSRNAERAMSRTDWMLVLAMAAPYLLLATIVGLIVLTG
jgi:hypothetical protein